MKNYIKQIVFALIMVLAYQQNYGQNWQWAKRAGGSMFDVSVISRDYSGNYYCSGGTMSSKCYFDNDTAIVNGYNDSFFAKYDDSGNEIWVQTFGGKNMLNCLETFSAPRIDTINSCIYLTGSICGVAQFGPYTLSSVLMDFVLVKFDLNGNCIWAKQAIGGGDAIGLGVTTDSDGNVYACGFNNDSSVFDGIKIKPGAFIVKYSLNGTCLWAKSKFGFSGYQPDVYPSGLQILNDNIIMGGSTVNDTIVLDTITAIYPKNFYSTYISCFDTAGNAKWLNCMAGPLSESSFEPGVSTYNKIYTTGYFIDTAFVGDTILYGTALHDAFIASYQSDGTFNWAVQAHAADAIGKNVVADQNGGVYCTGWFEGNATFGNYTVTSSSPRDAFIARYDSIGNCIGVVHFGQAEGLALCIDDVGDICVSGIFENTLNIGSQTFTSYGMDDFFIAKLDAITGINQLPPPNNQLLIYANPTQGKSNITIPDDMANEEQLTLTVYDNIGRVIQERTVYLTDNKIKLNLSAEAKGLYHVALSSGTKRYTGKIIFE